MTDDEKASLLKALMIGSQEAYQALNDNQQSVV
jgi:hypothetical protein